MTACTSFLAFFAEQTLAFAEKMHSRPDRWPQIVRFASGRADSLANQRFVNDQTFPPRLLAVEAREAVRRQAIGKSRPQTAGLWAIRTCPGETSHGRVFRLFIVSRENCHAPFNLVLAWAIILIPANEKGVRT